MSYALEIKYTKRKNTVGIKVQNNQVIVLAPKRTSKRFIFNLLNKKEEWIQKHLQKTSKKRLETNQLYIFGEKLDLQFKEANHNAFHYENGSITLNYKEQLDHKKILFLFDSWIKNTAKNYILSRATELAQQTALTPNKILLKNTKSQWGSCSRTKNVSLSYNLIYTPKPVIDYVIIHELSHLREMNHSKNFWTQVATHCPEYKESVQWLKEHGFLLNLEQELYFEF